MEGINDEVCFQMHDMRGVAMQHWKCKNESPTDDKNNYTSSGSSWRKEMREKQ